MSIFNNSFKNSRVLVTGHTGFKGSWLSLWLYNLGAEVAGISNNIPTEPSHYKAIELNKKIKDFSCDIRDRENLCKIIKDFNPDFIFHLAAQAIVKNSLASPIETFEINSVGSLNVLEAIRSTKKKCVVVLITSDKCYENKEWTFGYRENDQLGGKDPYSASKAAAEIAIRSYFHTFLKNEKFINIGIARAGNVIGGGDWANGRLVPDCIRAWKNNSVVNIRNPHSTRPWQHVLEPLSGYLLLADNLYRENILNGNAFNFGPLSTQNYTVGEIVKYMSDLWPNSKCEFESFSESRFVESSLLKLNCDKAHNLLNWFPVLDYQTTVLNTIDWFKNYYILNNFSSLEFSRKQIESYVKTANKKGLSWAIK